MNTATATMYEDLYVVVACTRNRVGYALSTCQAPDSLTETLTMLHQCASEAIVNTLDTTWVTNWEGGEIMSSSDIEMLIEGTAADHDQVSTIVSVTATDDPCGNAAQRAMRY